VIFDSVTLPQLVTTPLTRLPRPIATLLQFLVTAIQAFSVTMQTLVALAVTNVPQVLRPLAITMLVKLPQVLFVTSLL
jgi:hypothetical protein